MKFSDFNLHENTLKAIESIGFVRPTKIQELVLPAALDNKSLSCKGKTGSGKTHCFLIPLAEKIRVEDNNLQALILLPTRELAIQTYQRCKEFFASFNLNIAILTGGNDTERLEDKLTNNPQILIGTPEKIVKLGIEKGLVNFQFVNTLIIDEADMSLEMGFLNEVDKIASLVNKKAQFMMFSATIPNGLKQFIRKYFSNPLIIEDTKSNNNTNIEHILYPTRGRNEKELLLKIIKNINPYVCLIFLNTKQEVNSYYEYLINNDVDCEMIHGDLMARERKRNIKKTLSGKFRFIVCSDIASRGIDIDGVSHVISIGFPKTDLSFYTHRAGRCGRNNYKGQSITLYSPKDNNAIMALEQQGIKFVVKEIKNDTWKELKEFNARGKRKDKRVNQLDLDIQKAIRMNTSSKVKPNYKKKVKLAVEKVKRKHKRDVIKSDIKKRIVERAIKKNKGEK